MFGVHFQRRIFLLTTVLSLCLRVYSYELKWINSHYRDFLKIVCDEKETLDSTRPTKDFKHNISEIKMPPELVFLNCPPPNKPYLEMLKDINIDASEVSRITFSNMAETDFLKETLFEGMPLKRLSINGYDVSINSTGKLNLEKGSTYELNCYEDRSSLINRKPLFQERLLNVTSVTFNECTLPNLSYSDILTKLNIRSSSVHNLNLMIQPNSSDLRPDNFKGLSLWKLSVLSSGIFKVDPKIFEEIKRDEIFSSGIYSYKVDPEIFEEIKADEIFMFGVELKTLKKFRAKKCRIFGGKFLGEWGDCSTLTSLELSEVITPPGGWLHRCNNLTDLNLFKITTEGVKRTLLSARALNTLFIGDCGHISLTEPFAKDSVNLRRLTLRELSLRHISEVAFSALKALEELDISYNTLTGFQIFQAIRPLKNLRKLVMDENSFETFCEDQDLYMKTTNLLPPGIETVSLQNSKLPTICFSNWQSLKYLDLSHNRIISLGKFMNFPMPDKHPLIVDLSGNPLKILPGEYDYDEAYLDYIAIVRHFKGSQNITILMDWTIECDCEHTWFVKTLRKLPQISLQNATCTSGQRVVDFNGEKFNCDKYPCNNCTCRSSWEDGATVADCDSRRLHAFPAVWLFLKKKGAKKIGREKSLESEIFIETLQIFEFPLKKILASGNFIETLPEYEYPKSLVEVDLSNNKIFRLSVSALDALFLGGNRSVYLSGNPFVCDCESQAMLDALSMHRYQVPDYINLKCSNQDSYLHEFSHRSLCTEQDLLFFGAVTATIIALTTIMTLLYYRFKLTMKAFLYARGLCLFCVREEELDADKEYDAFISFANADNELVANTLLPGLQNDYNICVHTRNWMPGEFIHTQIINSVNQSRRTIIVLSNNFLESLWGMTEFRTAYINSLQEGRVRVICIVVDDVIDEMELEPDLKAYLKSNTYLKWNDPFFWQKLRYALPHRSVEQSRVQNRRENTCQEIELDSR